MTLPDVDAVICLGTAKQLTFDPERGISRLRREWISKASATQRAGRTARTRPGTVYRLYPRQLYEAFHDFNPSEITTMPLENTLLQLRTMAGTGESIVELLQQVNRHDCKQRPLPRALPLSHPEARFLTTSRKQGA